MCVCVLRCMCVCVWGGGGGGADVGLRWEGGLRVWQDSCVCVSVGVSVHCVGVGGMYLCVIF